MKASISSTSFSRAIFARLSTKVMNSSFLATKSVSEFTSTMAAALPSAADAIFTRPIAAILPAFFAALARPFSLRSSTALSISPSVSTSAFLQSIIPAPVISRSSFTILAVTAIFVPPDIYTIIICTLIMRQRSQLRLLPPCPLQLRLRFQPPPPQSILLLRLRRSFHPAWLR